MASRILQARAKDSGPSGLFRAFQAVAKDGGANVAESVATAARRSKEPP